MSRTRSFFALMTGAALMFNTHMAGAQAVPSIKAEPFELKDVRLLPGRFKENADRHAEYLMSLDADRLLSGFRSEAGLAVKAPKYGGWESQGVAGHTLGHYLSGLAISYASTGDERYRERAAYVVAELAECQAANGDGYVAAIPDGRRIFSEIARGDIRSKGFDLNGGWVPFYTIHKTMAGLYDAYRLCGNQQALEVLKSLGDWLCRITEPFTEDQLRIVLACEFGGLNESAADLYGLTGDSKYLALAKRFTHHDVLDPVAEGRDRLRGLHANTQIPKVVGEARRYELDGDDYAYRVATNFWNTVVHHHTYVTGGNSDAEHFGPPDIRSTRLSDHTTETCNTYNMLKLTRHLFTWSGDAAYADYYERALVNHILGSLNHKTSQVNYFVPLRHGGSRRWEGLYDRFSCCVGTGLENHFKYGDSIYFHSGDALDVNLFIASELNWADQQTKVRMESPFPAPGRVTIQIDPNQPKTLALRVRRPAWAETFNVTLNGKPVAVDAKPGSYAEIRRQWQAGDRVEIDAPYTLRVEPQPDAPTQVAIFNGPVLLAGLVEGNEPHQTVLLGEPAKVVNAIKPTNADKSEFATRGNARPTDIRFVPFYSVQEGRYAIYFDTFTPQQWEKAAATYRADQERKQEMDRRLIDHLAIGEMQPERDHDFAGENTRVGEHLGRKWRDASNDGWFEVTMVVDPNTPNDLVVTYWGGEDVKRRFRIFIDGKPFSTQVLHKNRPGEFFEVAYPLTREQTAARSRVRVRFEGIDGSMAGGVFDVKMLRGN